MHHPNLANLTTQYQQTYLVYCYKIMQYLHLLAWMEQQQRPPEQKVKPKSATGVKKLTQRSNQEKPTLKSLKHQGKPDVSTIVALGFPNGAMSAAFRVAFNEALYVKNGDDAVLTKSSLNVKGGYGSVKDAVLAQYAAYDAEYQTASDNSNELLGAIFKTGSSFYFTNVVEVGERFNVGISISGIKKGSSYAGFTHTHPGGFGFGGGDDVLPISSNLPFFVRLSRGQALRLDPAGARAYGKFKAGLRRGGSTGALTKEINARRYGITNICGGTSSCLNKLQ